MALSLSFDVDRQDHARLKRMLIMLCLMAGSFPLVGAAWAQPYAATDVDFDGSGNVTFADFILFASAFGEPDPTYDVDGGGIVDFNDFLILVQFFGTVLLEPVTVGERFEFLTPSGDAFMMVLVPGGDFLMGSDSTVSNQRPLRTVFLDSFLIDRYEVTNSEFSAFLNSKGAEDGSGTLYVNLEGRVLRIVEAEGVFAPTTSADFDQPVVHVTWTGAQAYCTWAGGRLPTEAEWEKAARGTDGRIYPWGNDPPSPGLLNYNKNIKRPTDVGSYPRGVSPYGSFDLAGNVFEWVADYYQADYYGEAPNVNPLGPDSGVFRVIRGGSHPALVDDWVTTTFRQPAFETEGLVDLGFRCARTR